MKPEKPEILTPRNLGLASLLALFAVAVFAVVMFNPVSEIMETKAATEACEDAAAHHYREALKAGPDSEYHFWAGAAAEKLAATGGSCKDWNSGA